MNSHPRAGAATHDPASRTQHRHRRLVVGAALLLGLAITSCMTTNRVLLAPPQIPGATYVGSQTCAECHPEITRDFKTADHARIVAKGTNAIATGCESCHGPGSLHNASGGAPHTIVNPHRSPETCFQCHLDKQAQFRLPYHHQVLEGKVTCSDCHNPHKWSAIKGGGTSLLTQQETCYQCHTVQRGPFVYEHEALREGCTICHQPHGSVNNKMLVARNANLCLSCHFQPQTKAGIILIGGRDHTSFLSRGACWSAGCHEAIHGSQVSSSLRF